VVRKATTLLGEGVREAAAATAANDYLFAHEGGETLCALDIVTLEPHRHRLVLARNSSTPVVVVTSAGIHVHADTAPLLGAAENVAPALHDLALTGDTYVVVADEGLALAGRGGPGALSLRREVTHFFEIGGHGAERLADALLDRAVELDGGRAAHDLSVLVLAVRVRRPVDVARRLVVRVPLPA